MSQRFLSVLATTLALFSAAGCSTNGRQVEREPVLLRPSEAGTLTLYRDRSLVGLFAAMNVKLDRKGLYRLKRGQTYSVQIDPGSHLLEYSIGFNECGRAIYLRPGESVRLRLSADCMIQEE